MPPKIDHKSTKKLLVKSIKLTIYRCRDKHTFECGLLHFRGWKRNNLNVINHYSFTFFGRYSLFISNFFPIIHYSFTIAKGIECLQNTIARYPLFYYKAWFTLATEAETGTEAETEESLRSSVNHEDRDGRILTF